MTRSEDIVVDRLRRAFAADERSRPAARTCPRPERLWDALHARLEPGERREIVGHISGCAACAADWRVAMQSEELAAEMAATEDVSPRIPAPSFSRWIVPVAAAAALAVVAFLTVQQLTVRETAPPVYRAAEEHDIRSLLPGDAALPRSAALLRWSAVGEGALYSVEIDTPDLEPLAAGHGLEAAEFLVPSDALEAVPAGGTIVWKVEALLPDGSRVASPAFLARIE
jgi:hypothetical protein